MFRLRFKYYFLFIFLGFWLIEIIIKKAQDDYYVLSFAFFYLLVFKKRLSFFTRYVNAHFALCKIILLQYTVL